ncbi:LysR family transcriptional regulator [Pandoraea sp. XJJ-1]|uniref:LysR family transcriptional regulator n=1 Tax=Pandoraea sp. XJJ-1 TaxID=3002643 RepID=UPI002281BD4A|nr:LysR family transcriptional regulator [Pandoraea sp. XJJ-1]WAL84920.1 LysR family transcriptional regulator [Pandoraea sp. XJJ-1]
MNQLQAVRVFLNVAETGSFGSAAAKLNLSNAVVTRYVALLEEHLGARLLNRTTRRLSLTETGRLYARGCRQIFDQLDEMEAGVENASRMPSGELRIASSTTFSLQALTPLLTLYRLRYPSVHLAVDLFDGSVNFIEDGYDVGMLAPVQVNSTRVVSRPLLSVAAVAVASAELTQEHGSPTAPQDLRKFPLLCLQTDARNPTLRFTKENANECVSFDPVYAANNLLMLKQAVKAGMGGAVLPQTMIADELAQGELGQILPGWQVSGNEFEVALIYPGRRNISAKTRTFVEMAIEHFGQGVSL